MAPGAEGREDHLYRRRAIEINFCLTQPPPVPNSKARIITYDPKTKEVIWEGRKVGKNDPIPEVED